MEEWKSQETDYVDTEYIGVLEFQDYAEEWHVFEILKTKTHLVFGSGCNIGFMESGNMLIDTCFSLDENLQELCEDLEAYYNHGSKHVAYITCNERM